MVTEMPERNKWLWGLHPLRWKQKNTNHQRCQEKKTQKKTPNPEQMKKRRNESVKVQKGRTSVKIPSLFLSLMLFVIDTNPFFFIFTAKESVLCCILCCSAAYLYRRRRILDSTVNRIKYQSAS